MFLLCSNMIQLYVDMHVSPSSWASLPSIPYPSRSSQSSEIFFLKLQNIMYFNQWELIKITAAAAAKSLQSRPTLCDPIDGSPPGSPVPGILQARTLEWVVISFSNAWKWKVKGKSLGCVQLLATPWTAAYQAPPSMDFPGKSTGVGSHCFLWIKITTSFQFNLASYVLAFRWVALKWTWCFVYVIRYIFLKDLPSCVSVYLPLGLGMQWMENQKLPM